MNEDIQVGDCLNFRDADNPAKEHGGHEVTGFDEDGNPQVCCQGEILSVKPEQIEKVWR